jgi:hypothetical protein
LPSTPCLLVSLALLAAPLAAQAPQVELLRRSPAPAETARLERAQELARLDAARGGYVLWLYSAEEDHVATLVAATYPDRPLVASEQGRRLLGTWNLPTVAADFVRYGTWDNGISDCWNCVGGSCF